jgi:GrpB-like predicted nucleotidyltransferase (UPF0157 family)
MCLGIGNLLKPPQTSPIRIVDYDPHSPARFDAEKALIRRAAGPLLVAIEHVGSTAVPDLAGKPIIDIMAGLDSLTRAGLAVEPLQSIGYVYMPEFEVLIPDRRFFRKWSQNGARRDISHHLHLAEMSSEFWESHLLFRDYLRTHPDDARRYETLKRELASRYGADRDGYTNAKTDFVTDILARAKPST